MLGTCMDSVWMLGTCMDSVWLLGTCIYVVMDRLCYNGVTLTLP